jgi:circadian clock protein KaiC
LQSLAHGVLMLEHFQSEFGGERRRLSVVKMRGVAYSGGYHDYSIVTGGFEVFPRVVAAEHRTGRATEPFPSGIEPLDRLLGGGLDRGTSTLVIGPAGSGKSTLAMLFARTGADRGDGAAVFLFDEARETALARMRGIGMGLDAHIQAGRIKVTQVDPAQLSPGEFLHHVRAAVGEGKSRVVVIDSINGLLQAMPSENHLVLQLHDLLMYLGQKGVLTLLVVAEHGVMGRSIAGPLEVSYLADTVVLVRYFEAQGAVRKALSVMKKRTGRHEKTIREYDVTSSGIRIGEPLEEFQGVLTGVPAYTGQKSGAGGP